MTAATENTLSKVDSLVDEPQAKKAHRRASSSVAADVYNISDLLDDLKKDDKKEPALKIAPDTRTLNWKMNTSPATFEDKDVLKKFLTEPKLKKIDLQFVIGNDLPGPKVTARNLKGVTIKDALDAIYKQQKKKADDELENPILAGFEWNQEESWTYFKIHQKKEGAPQPSKKKKKGGDE